MFDDDLSRNVYCILGAPIDAIDMQGVVRQIEKAVRRGAPFLLSTPNLNYLVNSQTDIGFRRSLLISDLCPPDGMPIVWIAKILGLQVRGRVSGADIFEALATSERGSGDPMRVFFFGGKEGIAAAACKKMNARCGALRCVGSLFPGFGSVADMSDDATLNKINSSGAELLVVSLGAEKGQSWLQHNRDRLCVPVQAHLGAVVNFQADAVKRSPRLLRSLGLEWLWRIKEEPALWRRYWNDGLVLFKLLFTHILPLALLSRWLRLRSILRGSELIVRLSDTGGSVIVKPVGSATVRNIDAMIEGLKSALAAKKSIEINFEKTLVVDARFLGLLLMVDKNLKASGNRLLLRKLSRNLKTVFRLSGAEFLLDSGD